MLITAHYAKKVMAGPKMAAKLPKTEAQRQAEIQGFGGAVQRSFGSMLSIALGSAATSAGFIAAQACCRAGAGCEFRAARQGFNRSQIALFGHA